jgi:hypothetical protein
MCKHALLSLVFASVFLPLWSDALPSSDSNVHATSDSSLPKAPQWTDLERDSWMLYDEAMNLANQLANLNAQVTSLNSQLDESRSSLLESQKQFLTLKKATALLNEERAAYIKALELKSRVWQICTVAVGIFAIADVVTRRVTR